MWQAEILTLFPAMVTGYLEASILGKAQRAGACSGVEPRDIREHAEGKHRVTDDAPYGGGAGHGDEGRAAGRGDRGGPRRASRGAGAPDAPRGATASPRRRRARSRPVPTGLILVCGRYEGVDERVRAHVDGELSLGDFVLTGGELAALSVVDAVARLLPGVLGNAESSGVRELRGGAARVPAVHPPPGLPRRRGPRGAPGRGPRPHRPLAALARAAAHPGAPAGPASTRRGSRDADRRAPRARGEGPLNPGACACDWDGSLCYLARSLSVGVRCHAPERPRVRRVEAAAEGRHRLPHR